jgi:hypothetical protein
MDGDGLSNIEGACADAERVGLAEPVPVLEPAAGDAVWVNVNGWPVRRYFVSFYSTGVRLAFDRDLKQVVYYEHDARHMYEKRSDLLQLACEGLEETIRDRQARLVQLRSALADARSAEASREGVNNE